VDDEKIAGLTVGSVGQTHALAVLNPEIRTIGPLDRMTWATPTATFWRVEVLERLPATTTFDDVAKRVLQIRGACPFERVLMDSNAGGAALVRHFREMLGKFVSLGDQFVTAGVESGHHKQGREALLYPLIQVMQYKRLEISPAVSLGAELMEQLLQFGSGAWRGGRDDLACAVALSLWETQRVCPGFRGQ
jgi:hypothetical protein